LHVTGRAGIPEKSKAVEVAAAVIQRPDGAFLLAQRPHGKVYAGYWEFPGGKVEPGEPAVDALARELHEELGIDVETAYPWITRVFTYPHATVRLNFFRVTQWRGEPHPKEDQAIAWQEPAGTMASPMLPANAPVLASLALPAEYAITDSTRWGTAVMLDKLERRMAQGLKLVQLREPGLSAEERRSFCENAIRRATRYGCKVMVKEPHAGADGIHFTASQLMSLNVKPRGMLVAASCHTREELERAMQLDLDFAVLGPVKETTSHPRAAAMGWKVFGELAHGASIPVYAIGGLTRADLEDAWRAGAHGVAMIRGAWS
jgi:8-oxo-dGTP diphosphatase